MNPPLQWMRCWRGECLPLPIDRSVESDVLRGVYHLCRKIMPMLELAAQMGTSTIETFTPAGIGGDINLAEA